MRRIVILLVGLLFLMQVSAFAEISRQAGSNYTQISSHYSIKYQVGENESLHDCYLFIQVMSSRAFASMWSEEHRYFMITDMTNEDRELVFSKKNQLVFEVINKGKSSIVPFKKIDRKGDNYIWFSVKKDSLTEIYNADQVFLVLPTTDKKTRKFEIPKKIVDEWKTVLTADLKKVRKDILEE